MYDRRLTEASKGALVELCMALSEYRHDFVVAGGWASYFLSRKHFDHCGSVDIDLVLRPKVMPRYMTIKEAVQKLDYRETSSPFRFKRRIATTDGKQEFEVELDFITEPEAVMELDILVEVQEDLRACLIRGIGIVFNYNYEEHVEAILPGGGEATTSVRVADIVGSLTSKGLALPRLKDKDSYDIYAVAGFYEGSPTQAATTFNKLIQSRSRVSSQ